MLLLYWLFLLYFFPNGIKVKLIKVTLYDFLWLFLFCKLKNKLQNWEQVLHLSKAEFTMQYNTQNLRDIIVCFLLLREN